MSKKPKVTIHMWRNQVAAVTSNEELEVTVIDHCTDLIPKKHIFEIPVEKFPFPFPEKVWSYTPLIIKDPELTAKIFTSKKT